MRLIIATTLLSLMLSACSTEQAYYGAREAQKKQCDQYLNTPDYERCMQEASMDYDEYQRKRGADK